VFIILLLYIIDMFTIFLFHSRVSIAEALVLWSNWSSGFAWIIKLWVFIFILTWLLVFFLVQTKMSRLKKSKANTIIVFSVCSAIYSLFCIVLIFLHTNINYVENILSLNFGNTYEYNLNSDQNGYSIKNVQWEWKDVNIILVFAESLSAIDSSNVGWNDKMPWFDKIQKDGITFTNFITNWTTSDTAHIATLLWVVPLRNMRVGNTPYSWYKLKMEALPDYLNSQWYATTFVSAASLDFLKQRDFLSWAW